jgi:aspartate/methionine/tyrosine aminotransferase
MKPLSEITTKFTESVIREMTRISNARGGINLAQGFPDFDPPSAIRQAAIDAIQQGWNQYAVTFGEADLREAIVRKALQYNRIECDPHTDVTVTCGATEAMIATLKALVNPGDEIIIFEPFYENYGPDAILSGARPRYVTLRYPDWSYDSKELTAAFNRNTKAIIINTPNNPTGKVFSRKELEEIGRLCIKWDAVAITDEIYEHILYDQETHTSMASMDGMAARTVTINSLSKTYSVTGWRVGWAIAEAGITRRIRKVHDFLTVGAPTPFQKAGVCALNMPGEYYTALQERYTGARNRICNALKAASFTVEAPKGAYYIMAHTGAFLDRYTETGADGFGLKLLDITGIATVPGSAFYHSPAMGKDQVRFCFAKNEQTIEAVCRRLERLTG